MYNPLPPVPLREGGARQHAASRYPRQCEGGRRYRRCPRSGRACKQEGHGDASQSPSLQCGYASFILRQAPGVCCVDSNAKD